MKGPVLGINVKDRIRRIARRTVYWGTVTMLLIVVLIGSWCIPPRLLEKVLLGVKAKFHTEIVRSGNNGDGETTGD